MKRRTIESPPLSTERSDTPTHPFTALTTFRPAQFRSWWEDVQDSLWLIPALGTLFCGALAFGLVWLDHRLALTGGVEGLSWVFTGGSEGARGVLSAIAASIITVTATIFSIAVVAMQLASGQFTPRVLRQFTGDRANQIVLAVFIGTFTYSMLVLRTVRSEADAGGTFVPLLAVAVAIILSLVCIGLLIFFIHHAARSIQVSVIIDTAADDTADLVRHHFREQPGTGFDLNAPRLPDGESFELCCRWGSYVQDLDEGNLLALARDHDLTIHVLEPVGAFAYDGAVLARVWPAAHVDAEVDRQLHNTFVTGIERTLHHDVAFGVRQLADIAIKALSPGINDPTTATHAVDRLGGILTLAGRRLPPARILTVDGRPAVFLPTITFEELLDLSYTQIRHFGAGDVVFISHLLVTLRRISDLVPPERHGALRRHTLLARDEARTALTMPEDIEAVDRLTAWLERDDPPLPRMDAELFTSTTPEAPIQGVR
ncbi:MAG: DUF2254 domain-containing protein [Chloroflexota bacterium]|nr:DUF2254 domain-containing protein [Chloroflexota bacterium]